MYEANFELLGIQIDHKLFYANFRWSHFEPGPENAHPQSLFYLQWAALEVTLSLCSLVTLFFLFAKRNYEALRLFQLHAFSLQTLAYPALYTYTMHVYLIYKFFLQLSPWKIYCQPKIWLNIAGLKFTFNGSIFRLF